MRNLDEGTEPARGYQPSAEKLKQDRKSTLLFLALGISMLLAALALPFAMAKQEPETWLTLLQILLWIAFGSSWFFQGHLLGRSGFSFDPDDPVNEPSGSRWGEVAFYVLCFAPTCFGYIYVSNLNTGYFGFNYVLLFVLAGFSPLVFNAWGAALCLLFHWAAWILLARLMWGGWLNIVDSFTFFSGYCFSAMMFYIFRRERRSRGRAFALSAELDRANDQLRASYRQAEELAATHERNRIAREIHDTIGHSLTVVNMQIETAKALISKDSEKAVTFLEKAQTVTKKGLSEIRDSVASLRATPLDGKTLAEAIEALLETSQSGGLGTHFDLKGNAEKLPPAQEAALYRCAQEALTNVRKHAAASEVRVELSYSNQECVMLSVFDDGRGASEVEGGFGIMGIRERIQLLDGKVSFFTSPGEGFQLSVSIPR